MASNTTEVWPDRAIHPGVYLAQELEARGMTQAELSRRMGRPVQVINEIVRCKKSISVETALGLERVLGTSARMWMNLQSNYLLVQARQRRSQEVAVAESSPSYGDRLAGSD